jgi:hypothetical protein
VIYIHKNNYGHKTTIPYSVGPWYETNIEKHADYERKEE